MAQKGLQVRLAPSNPFFSYATPNFRMDIALGEGTGSY